MLIVIKNKLILMRSIRKRSFLNSNVYFFKLFNVIFITRFILYWPICMLDNRFCWNITWVKTTGQFSHPYKLTGEELMFKIKIKLSNSGSSIFMKFEKKFIIHKLWTILNEIYITFGVCIKYFEIIIYQNIFFWGGTKIF